MNEARPRVAPDTVHNAPVTTIGDHSPQAVVHDRTGLFIAIMALVFSSAAMGAVAMYAAMAPESVNAQTVAAQIAAGVAAAEERARAAEVNARLALDRNDRMRAQLEEKRILTRENH